MKKFRNAPSGGNYISKTKAGICKNNEPKPCVNRRRHGSAYCEDCAVAHEKIKA